MSLAMNPSAFFLRTDDGVERRVHVERLQRGYDGKERWVVLAKCPTREKAEQLAEDGFGGGPNVRVTDAA